MKEIIKAQTRYPYVYVIQNYGTWRGMFYTLRDAKRFVQEEGMNDGKPIYQIYKATVNLDIISQKSPSSTTL
jgi:hypothetical protein